MKYIILEKAQVKPYTRTRKGKMERVESYSREQRLAHKEFKRTLISHKRAEWNAMDRFNERMKLEISTMTPEKAFDYLVAHRVDEMMGVHMLKEQFGLSDEDVLNLMESPKV